LIFGLGTFWHSNGDIFKGEFVKEQAEGLGIYIHADGKEYRG